MAVSVSEARVSEGTATPVEQRALTRLAERADAPTSDLPAAADADRVSPVARYRVTVPRVYIHIFDERDREAAGRLEDWLTGTRRWLVPGIENVVATALRRKARPPAGTSSIEVRYFHQEDASHAREIARFMGPGTTPKLNTSLRAPAGQLEVWFPARR